MADMRHMTGAGRFHIDTNVLDTNHDGFLSREEASANVTLNNQFTTLDTNNDGRIATDELRTWIHNGGLAKNSLPLGDALSGVGMANAFQTLDLNGDGRLTAKEAGVQARLGARFRTADTNRDGYLTQAEFDAWANASKR
jgi:Ca2+-binding EF-hand superfamily protein